MRKTQTRHEDLQVLLRQSWPQYISMKGKVTVRRVETGFNASSNRNVRFFVRSHLQLARDHLECRSQVRISLPTFFTKLSQNLRSVFWNLGSQVLVSSSKCKLFEGHVAVRDFATGNYLENQNSKRINVRLNRVNMA